MIDFISRLVTSYGYVVEALLIALESAGLPLPGETALLVSAAYAGNGKLKIGTVILVAAGAAILGDAGGYWLGRILGRSFVQKYGGRFWLNEEKLDRMEKFFKKHGSKTVFFGRFIGILRTYSAFFAGMSGMPYKSFTLFNALGGILWATIFGLLGYEFGKHLPVLERISKLIGWGALVLVMIVIASGFVWRMLQQHEKKVLQLWNRFAAYPPVVRFNTRYKLQLGWLRRRLQPGQYLGLHLTLGLLFAAVCLWLFGAVL